MCWRVSCAGFFMGSKSNVKTDQSSTNFVPASFRRSQGLRRVGQVTRPDDARKTHPVAQKVDQGPGGAGLEAVGHVQHEHAALVDADRKSTRLNSSHLVISYAVFCLKKKK